MPDKTFKEKLEQKNNLNKRSCKNAIARKKYVSVPINSFASSSFDFYQKTCLNKNVSSDIDLLTSLVLSDKDDMSHLELVRKDFENGVLSPFADDLLDCLADNSKLIADICG